MDLGKLPSDLKKVYCIGIKGTGICALAELFVSSGISVSGSDTDEIFYTDIILKELGIPFYTQFDASHVPVDVDLVIHSAAYNEQTNPEIIQARQLGIPLLKYTDALGAYSALFDSAGITGVHGKTSTTAMTGVLFRGAGLPARVLAGSAVAAFGGRSTLSLGDKYFAAETCEYRRHFMAFHPRVIILTSVESDHQDCFPAYTDIRDAFIEYVQKLPPGGVLIYCADNAGACEVTEIVMQKRKDIIAVPYGFNAQGRFRITSYAAQEEKMSFSLSAFPKTVFTLKIPGKHNILNATAALALTDILVKKEFGTDRWTAKQLENIVRELEGFSGSKRRSEVLGEKTGILFMDDYGHHPTAIASTLRGLKEFYPKRRIIVSFMSHTYTRTAALLDDFAVSLLAADMVFLHKIYASAREIYEGGVNGHSLFEKTKAVFNDRGHHGSVFYVDQPEDAAEQLKNILHKGDLFITMGAGDNWRLGQKLFMEFNGETA